MTAPDKAENQLGRTILSADIISKLHKINPSICVPQPDSFGWYPGKSAGMTCLWNGQPNFGRKISAIHLGAVPEFTQISPEGGIIVMGWRRIFARVVKSGAATKRQIEHAFRVQLDTDGSDGLCRNCVREGFKNKHNGGALLMCDVHEATIKVVERARENQRERKFNATRRGRRRTFDGPTVYLGVSK